MFCDGRRMKLHVHVFGNDLLSVFQCVCWGHLDKKGNNILKYRVDTSISPFCLSLSLLYADKKREKEKPPARVETKGINLNVSVDFYSGLNNGMNWLFHCTRANTRGLVH